MNLQTPPSNFSAIISAYGTWFGPPRIRFDAETIDGRKRQAAWEKMPLSIRRKGIPTKDARTKGDLAQLLCLAGHYDRAREHIPEELTDIRDIAAYCHCEPEIVAPIRAAKRHAYKRRARNVIYARRDTIEHIRQLMIDAERRGRDIKCDEVREVLRPWF
jgi:hypothetical protein